MHTLKFDAAVRIPLPEAKRPNLQSVYIFNMYRAASTATTAVIKALSNCTDLVQFNIADELNKIGVALIDHKDFTRPSVYLEDHPENLTKIGSFGGFVYSGFREIPLSYARQFAFHGAAVIVVRDLRDIGISQYNIVSRHTIHGAAGGNIKKLREITAQQSLDEFMASADTVHFLKRLANCYRPLIRKGTTVLRFEDYAGGDGFDTERYALDLVRAVSPYAELKVSEPDYVKAVLDQVKGTQSLKGHSTGGAIGLHRRLKPQTQKRLENALKNELVLLGYS
ncbi:MAG: hypothetical protein QNJ44_21255 [Rhodobacter sp.]|nr:hypothetical protein [Rhodobacter sp.]